MKKLFILALGVLVIPYINAQTLGEINRTGNESISIQVLKKNNKPYYYTFNCTSTDIGAHEIWVNPKDASKFRNALFESKVKFSEWIKIAEENKVGDFTKDIPVDFPKVKYAWKLGDWFFCSGKFKLTFCKSKGAYFALLYMPITSDTNRYISTNFTLTIYNEDEFQAFIDAFSYDNIQKTLNEHSNYDIETNSSTIDYDRLFK